MTGMGEDVYTDRSAALDALTEGSQRMGMYGDAPDGVAELIEAAVKAAGYEISGNQASAALESLGIPLSVLAAIRAGEWVAVPKELTEPMRAAWGDACHEETADGDWRAFLAAAPKTPEE